MIWHIFKKDWKLLWPMVVGVALVNLIQPVILSSMGPFELDRASPIWNLRYIFGEIGRLATGMLILMVVLQDAVPGLRQDWLVRPIRRRDLMLSKTLFVVLAVQCPIFIIDLAQGLAGGFTPWQSLSASFSLNLWMLLFMDLPVLAFATLSRNLAEAIGAGLVVLLGSALFTTSTLGLLVGNATTIGWVIDSAQVAWSVPAVAAVMGLQYLRRRTIAARWLFGSSALVWLFVQLLPWQPAFAVEERLSPQPAAAHSVQLAFEPTLGRFRGPQALEPHRYVMGRPQRDVVVYLPLRTDGVGNGGMLVADRMKPRLIEPGGRTVELPEVGGTPLAHQLTFIPEDVYNGIKDRPVRLELDYWLTLLQAAPAQSMPALNGAEVMPGVGRCATRVSPGGQFELGCLAPGKAPCFTWTLEFYDSNPCRLDYAPWFVREDQNSLNRFGGTFLFPHPADASQLKSERVIFHVYRPEAHFTRHVVIPDIRLSDWTAQ